MLRGIDIGRGLYFLLTPVAPSILRKVNCLLLGAVLLPSCILTTQVRSLLCCFITLYPEKTVICPALTSKGTFKAYSWYLSSPFQPGFEGEMPYVTTDYSFDLTGAGKLRVFKGLTRPSHLGPKWHFRRCIAVYLLDWCLTPHQSRLAFECTELRLWWTVFFSPSSFSLTEQPVLQTLQIAAFKLLDLQPPTVRRY